MTSLPLRALAISGFLGLASASAATRVDLVIDEPTAARAVPWPITTGVPFPRGQLSDAEHCRLLDDMGRECPLQARVAATWDAQRSSARWLTIDFIAEPGRKYVLEFGQDVKQRPAESTLRIEQGDVTRVATGVLTVDFMTKGPSALGAIRIDQNGDGQIEATEIIAAGSASGDHYCIDSAGRVASSKGDSQDRQIVVEARGPVRACVRVDGFYTGADGSRILAYRTRYHCYAGLGLIKVVDELRVVGSTKGVRWRDVGFALMLPERQGRRVLVDADGAPGNQILTVTPTQQPWSVSSFQTTYRHYGNLVCSGGVSETGPAGTKMHKQAEQVGEWLQVVDDRVAITGSLRWFWQQFPKEWEASADGLKLHLWSPRGGELDFSFDGIKRFFGEAGDKYLLNWQGVRSPQSPIENFFYFAGRAALERGDADGFGMNKHHDFYLHFAPAAQAGHGQEYGSLAALPPLALASGQWNCGTDVFGPLAARPSTSPEESIVDRLFDLKRYAQDNFGDYGWWLFGAGPHYSYQWDAKTQRHYADPRRFEHHTYHKEMQLWWCYLRSGERKFFDWALPSENHWVDIAVAHQPTTFRTEWRGGERSAATLPWPRGDWAIDGTVHYLRHHDNAEAWLRGQSQFWATYHRTLETTTLAYYLTGDERFNDVLEFWRGYWAELAGKTNASTDWKPWHREQTWYQLAPKDRPATWAEMIRDYAPFTSGSRHQLTLLFNLSTLYEHTWDAKIGQAVREYADAFLDPQHPIGVWRSQDNRGPARADAPLLAHYWAPALWKYARATGDPRMPDVLRRYYDACLDADPFAEDVGIYSNAHIGYGYYFTRDPRHVRAAVQELEQLKPHGAPLAKPEDLGQRLYNPYAPAQALAAVPRLLWAVQEAKRQGVAVPPPALTYPQRAPYAFDKPADKALEAVLWGYDRVPHWFGPDGRPFNNVETQTRAAVSALQPFDRTMPGFAVYQHRVTIPATGPAGWYVLAPQLEMAVLELHGTDVVVVNAATPLAVHPGQHWQWLVRPGGVTLRLESANPKSLNLTWNDGQPIPVKAEPGGLSATFTTENAGRIVHIAGADKSLTWVQLAGVPPEQCWVAPPNGTRNPGPAGRIGKALPARLDFAAKDVYHEGRFGKGLLITPGRTLHIPDLDKVDGRGQGTIEFWVKRLWDDRLTTVPKVTFLGNGLVEAWSPWKLPVGEWAHVAVVWRPLKRDPGQIIVQIYVDGLDQANYRSTLWEGYSVRPFSFSRAGKWLEEFVSRAPAGAAFVLDDLRLSSTARYTDLDADFGGQLTFNPFHFQPSTAALSTDRHTLRLFHFDGDLQDASGRQPAVQARLTEGKK